MTKPGRIKYIESKILKGSAWVLLGKFGTGSFQIFTGMILARLLTQEEFGDFQVFQRIFVFAGLFGSFGLGAVLVRDISKNLAINNVHNILPVIKSALGIIFPLSILTSTLISAITIANFSDHYTGKVWILGFIMFFLCLISSLQLVIPDIFRGLHNLKLASIFSGLFYNGVFMMLIGAIFLYSPNTSLDNILSYYIFSIMLAVGISSFVVWNKLKSLQVHRQSNKKICLVSQSLPIWLSSILQFVSAQSDIIIVSLFFSSKIASYYGVASKLVFVIAVPLMIANAAIQPFISNLWARKEKDKLQNLLRNVSQITFLAGLIPSILMVVYAGEILSFIYGSTYVNGMYILQVGVIGQVVNLMVGPAGTVLIMGGEQRYLLISTAISIALYAVSSICLSYYFGQIGIAVSVTLAAIVRHLLLGYYCKTKLDLNTFVWQSRRTTSHRIT